ncbi:NAD-dependent epimerase/dehydratase family protein [Candidatus Peribacteria bacterium]|nr:NAD-dependent epimerase/dehydratase family protein [Candidatus Peribacteria bacterium]
MEKVMIFGGRGFIAGHLKTIYPDAILPEIDICDAVALADVLEKEKPAVVINAAGKTGKPNVDWCEDHKLETVLSNVQGPLNLLDACARRGIYWVHIGSGCTYEGDNHGKGYAETDLPNFTGSFYARTKLWIDQILKDFPVLQLRLRMPFDGSTHPRNLISKLRKYTKILDEQNSITYLPDFLVAANILIAKRKTGIYNVVNPGTISPYKIMLRYQKIVDPTHKVERLTLDHLSDVVKAGRSNCTLSCEKLLKEGVRMRPVSEATDEALKALV